MARGGTRALAEWVCQRASDASLTASARAAAVERVVETLAASYHALPHPVSVATRALATEVTGSGCSVIGRAGGYPPADAALANGTTAHCALLEDHGPGGHPGTVVVPAALAAAELSAASGAQLVRAVVAGYEAVQRVAAATPPGLRDRHFRSLPTLGVFGAAAAAAVGLGLTSDGVAAALDMAADQAGGLYEAFLVGSSEAYLHAGFAARAGLTAARLAAAGVPTTGSSLDGTYGFFATLAGDAQPREPLVPVDDPQRYVVEQVRSKSFAACAQNQGSLRVITGDARTPLQVADIDSIDIWRPASGPHGVHPPGVTAVPPFATALQAQMSAIFTTCAALLGRSVGRLDFFLTGFDDPEVVTVCRRARLQVHDSPAALVRVCCVDGAVLEFGTDDQAAVAASPDPVQRFVELAGGALGDERARRAAQELSRMWTAPTVGGLSAALRGDC